MILFQASLPLYRTPPTIKTHLSTSVAGQLARIAPTLSCTWVMFWPCFNSSFHMLGVNTCHTVNKMESCWWRCDLLLSQAIAHVGMQPSHQNVQMNVEQCVLGLLEAMCGCITAWYHLHVPKCRLMWGVYRAKYPHFCCFRPSTVMLQWVSQDTVVYTMVFSPCILRIQFLLSILRDNTCQN